MEQNMFSPSKGNGQQPLQTIKDNSPMGDKLAAGLGNDSNSNALPMNTQKLRSDKYMVLQMGQNKDESQDAMLIQYLS
jgi:hypothetical protein